MKKTIKYLQDGEYHYATVKDVGDLEQLRTKHKEDLVTALNELFTTGGNAKPTGYDDLVKKVNDTQTTVNGINNTITDINGKVVANDEAIAQAKKGLQDALTQFQTFNDEIEQAKKDAETKLANAKQALKDEFNANLADAQKANQKQLEDKVTVIQGNLDTTSNTLNDVKTQLANAKLDYGNVNVSIQKLNDMLSTKLSSTDLDPLRTSIQNQETEIQQTKDSIATKAGKAELDVLSGRVSNTEAKIKQQADEISLGVKKSELNGAIDNYQIEGTNRLRNTIDFDIDGGYWKLDRYSINLNTDVHPYDQAHDVSALVLQKAGSAKQDVDFTNEDLGQSFVVSMWNKKDAQPQVWYGNTQLTNRQVAEIKGDYERSFFTFIPTNVNVKTIMFKYDAGTVDQLVIGEPKLELGTKPKAYAPNPNDEHKQIVNTKAELKIASDKIESTVEKQTKTDNNVNQLSSRVTQTEQGITAANDLITKTKDGLIKDYTGKINASAKSLSSEFDEKTNEKIGQITDSGENLILNSAFTNESDRKDKWQNISDKVNIVADNNGLMWAHMSQTGLTADNPISLTSNYFPIKQGKITVGVDIKSDNTSGLSGAKILVLQTYNANKQRVDFTELSLENMGLTISQLADGQSHRGVYRLGNDRGDTVYMTVKAVLPRNGSIYFTNFSAKLSSIDNGGYTPNADDLKRQILNQKTKIEQNSQQISLKASSTELSDVRTIANGAVSSADSANNKINGITSNGGGRNLLRNSIGKFQPNNSRIDNYIIYAASTVYMTQGQQYTVHANASDGLVWSGTHNPNATSNNVVLWLVDNKNVNQIISDANTGTRTTFTWNHPSGTYYLRVNTYKSDNSGYVEKVMLEKGAIAHDWTPSPEDVDANTDAKIDNLQIGGINLLKDTDKITNTNYWGLRGGQSIRATYGGKYANETGVALSDYNVQFNTPTSFIDYIPQITFEQGTDYTVSFWATIVSTPLLYLNANDGYNHQHYNSPQTISLQASSRTYNGWYQVTATFKPTVTTAYLTFGVSTDVNNKVSQYWASSFKLEKGNKATDWQPAPEDIQTQIDQARTDIQSTLTVANNGITAATNLKTTYDNYVQKNDANIKLLGDRITNEVSKITSNGGGRNLLTGTSGDWITKTASGWMNVTTAKSNKTSVADYHTGDKFTYSATVTNKSDSDVLLEMYRCDKDGNRIVGVPGYLANSDYVAPNTNAKRISCTITIDSNTWFIEHTLIAAGGTSTSKTVQIKGEMFEVGTIAHDWSPSPEDTQSQIEAVSSKIDQTATSITSTVNSTKQDLQGQINSANTKITQTADSITEQLKSYSKTGDMQNYVNTTIQKTADGINAKVSGVESKVDSANSKINDITSNGGGRNLALGTSNSWITAPDVDRWNITTIATYTNAQAGDVFTVSVDTQSTKTMAYQIWQGSSEYIRDEFVTGGDHWSIASGTTHSHTTFTWPSGATQYLIVQLIDYMPDASHASYQYKNVMLEKGTVAHDWSPAPEDVATDIETTKTDLVQQITDAKNAAIKVSKDSINSEVSDVRTTITQVNDKVSGVDGKVDSANSKINDITSNGGGRNLLIISSFVGDSKTFAPTFDAHWKCGNNTTWTFSSDKPVSSNDQSLQFTPKSSLPNTGNGIWYIAPQVKAGEVYTFSFWGKSTSDGFKMEVESFSDISKFTMTTAWKYYSGQLKFASDNRNMYFRISDDNSVNVGTVTIFHPMLEKGVVAHDWQPAPEDVATDISNVNTKVEQYKTGINQTATGMNLFAQVITGNKSIDVTKSNIGIDPNQIKIASNRIVIDGDTEFRGNSKWLDGKYINIEKLNYTASNTDYVDSVAFDSGGIIFSEYTRPTGTKTAPSSSNSKLGAVINVDYYQNKKVPGLSIVGNDVGMSAEPMGTTADPSSPVSHLLLRQGDFTLDAAQASGRGTVVGISGDITTGNLILDGNVELSSQNMTVQQGTAITVKATPTTQDKLMVVAQKNSNSTQDDYAQPTLRAGQSLTNLGDSGLTFYWNSVKAFGTFDLRDTHVLGNRNTHFSVETTFDTDGEANMCFTWTSRSDLWNNCKLPMLARADWWTSQWGSGGLGMANGNLFFFTNDGRTYRLIN